MFDNKVKTEDQESLFFGTQQSRSINFSSSHFFADIFRANLGPHGMLKLMEIDDYKDNNLYLTKDSSLLIRRLQIIHPTSIFIARAAQSHSDYYNDGVSSLIILIDSLLKQSEFLINEGVHPKTIVKGLYVARDRVIKLLDSLVIELQRDRAQLKDIVKSSSRTRHNLDISDICVDALNKIYEDGKPVDLERVEVMRVKGANKQVQLVYGIVIDQGFRHDMMPKDMKDVNILLLNVSLELEDTVNKTYTAVANADQMERMMIAERKFVDDKIRAIIALKDRVEGDFLVVNHKGIDGPSMDILSRANISALRRVSKKNVNRLITGCGCRLINSVHDLTPQILGFAESVKEYTFKQTKYVYIDKVKNDSAVTIVIGGVNEQISGLVKSAVDTSLSSLKHAFDCGKLLPGGGATEVQLSCLLEEEIKSIEGKDRVGISVYSKALLEIPRVLCSNSGLDPNEIISEMQGYYYDKEVGCLDCESGAVVDPTDYGIYDIYDVKRNIMQSAPIVASQLLLVDQIIESRIPRRKDAAKGDGEDPRLTENTKQTE